MIPTPEEEAHEDGMRERNAAAQRAGNFLLTTLLCMCAVAIWRDDIAHFGKWLWSFVQ